MISNQEERVHACKRLRNGTLTDPLAFVKAASLGEIDHSRLSVSRCDSECR